MRVIIFLYTFLFASILAAKATEATSRVQTPKNCIKYPHVIAKQAKDVPIVMLNPKKAIKDLDHHTVVKQPNTLSYYSVFNFINFFYTKDTLDNIKVM